MTEITHTPTPWRVYDNGSYIEIVPEKWGKDLPLAIGNVCSSYPYDKDQGLQMANAEHIVKCVNLHDELVEALKTLVGVIEYYASLKKEDQPNIEDWAYSSSSHEISIARRVLAKAGAL